MIIKVIYFVILQIIHVVVQQKKNKIRMTEITTISNNFVYSDTSIINPVDGINLFNGLYHPVKTYNINTSGTINITDTSSSSKWQLYIIHGTISRDIANEIAMFSITCNLADIRASTIIPADIHNSLNYVNIRVRVA